MESTELSSTQRLQSWLYPEELTPSRTAVHTLAARVRALAVDALYLDVEAVDLGELQSILDELDEVHQRFIALPNRRAAGTPAGPREDPTTLSERSPVSGRVNVVAPPMMLSHHPARDGEPGWTLGRVTFSELHEGPSGHVHGGVVAAMFDELLGVAQVHSGAAGYTVELDVRYLKITPLFVPVVYRAELESREGKVVKVRATSYLEDRPDVVLSSAVGTFIAQQYLPVPDDLAQA